MNLAELRWNGFCLAWLSGAPVCHYEGFLRSFLIGRENLNGCRLIGSGPKLMAAFDWPRRANRCFHRFLSPSNEWLLLLFHFLLVHKVCELLFWLESSDVFKGPTLTLALGWAWSALRVTLVVLRFEMMLQTRASSVPGSSCPPSLPPPSSLPSRVTSPHPTRGPI